MRIALVGLPLAADEGGYLHAAAQWRPGTSTYGDHFVDRPPLLMALFALADACGGTVALRVIGMLATLASILLASRIGGTPAAVTAAVMLTMASFEPFAINGELLAVPFVLASAWALLRALDATRRTGVWAAASGCAAACAFLVKQNVVDGFVLVVVLLGVVAWRGTQPERRATGRLLAAGIAGALLTVLAVLALAALAGTSPADLWDAVVVFRLDAAHSMANLPDAGADRRRVALAWTALLSAVPLVVAACLVRRPADPRQRALRITALALLTWEIVAIVAGGGYWSHYLIGLTPGVVLLVASTRPVRLLRAALAVALVAAVVQLVVVDHAPGRADDDAAVVTHLRAHARAGDTLVVAFGHPNVLRDSGLTSPYEHLWVLPTRVRDPLLSELTAVLTSPEAPDWLVVHGTSLAGLGLTHASAQRIVDRDYTLVATTGGWRILHRRDLSG